MTIAVAPHADDAAPAAVPGATRATLAGWGRRPVAEMAVHAPARDALRATLRAGGTLLARGCGRSYGDAAMNRDGGVVLTERLDRVLAFDPATGVVACEAGVTIAALLREFLPRGFVPPVLPGTKFVSLGGALACDVHGKNHHVAGSFARHVLDFVLLGADGEARRCSRDEHADLFWATAGGMGLTGIVTELRLRLRPVTSGYVRVDHDRAADLDEALALLETTDDGYAHSVAWIDCLARGRSLGRSVLMRGNAMPADELPRRLAAHPFGGPPRAPIGLGVDLPAFVLNPLTMRAFNAAYFHRHPARARGACVPHEAFFFPLDRVRDWNRLYGRRGFLQYQVALPFAGGRDVLVRILESVARRGAGSFLAVLKRFGPAEADAMLSFPIEGYTLALDLPYHRDVLPMLDALDDVVADLGGRVYLAKDARLDARRFRRMYPALPRWREVRERADPDHRFASDLSRRLGLEA